MAVEDGSVMVMVELGLPLVARVLGLKETVEPVGWPDAERAIPELSVPVMLAVMVKVGEEPATADSEDLDAESVKPALCELPVRAASRPALGLPQPVTRS